MHSLVELMSDWDTKHIADRREDISRWPLSSHTFNVCSLASHLLRKLIFWSIVAPPFMPMS